MKKIFVTMTLLATAFVAAQADETEAAKKPCNCPHAVVIGEEEEEAAPVAKAEDAALLACSECGCNGK